MVKLSKIKAKYILIVFWASWCGPCRCFNPEHYKLYKDKGFEILGVSLIPTMKSGKTPLKKTACLGQTLAT